MMVDDHEMVIQGLKSLLENQPGVIIVGTFTSGLIATEEFLDLQPDVILMDVHMPIVNGFEALELIKEKDNDARVLMLSMEVKKPYVKKAHQLGASGYVSKSAPIDDLVAAIRKVHEGGEAFSVLNIGQ